MEESIGDSQEPTGTAMQLWDLPEDVIIIIFESFDLHTLHSLYNTCSQLRNIVIMKNIIKHCNMSMNTMATVNTLKLDFFKDISEHLQVLNMCAVPDLSASVVIPALKSLRSLKGLDVSYTKINVLDLIEIPEICPSLKDISLNFNFGKKNNELSPARLLQCQVLFQQFENIHFVGDLLESKLAFYLLRNARLNGLTYSIPVYFNRHPIVVENVEIEEVKIPHYNKFFIYLMSYYGTACAHINLMCYPILLSSLDYKKYEIIVIIKRAFTEKVYASPIFIDFFRKHFNITADCITTVGEFSENAAFMMWNKNTTDFNSDFFNKLTKHIKQYVPLRLNLPCETLAPKDHSCFYITMAGGEFPNVVLDYDEVFQEQEDLKLRISLQFYKTKLITLSPYNEYLKKLTFLDLSGNFEKAQYDAAFFNVLFSCCVNLATLNVEHDRKYSICMPNLSTTLPLSKSLRNIRIAARNIDLVSLFSSFSQCKYLENIHTVDKDNILICEVNNLPDPAALLEKCPNLYSVYILAPMSEETRQKTAQMYNDIKRRYGKDYVKVMLEINNGLNFKYYPFVDVFRLCQIRPIDVIPNSKKKLIR